MKGVLTLKRALKQLQLENNNNRNSKFGRETQF